MIIIFLNHQFIYYKQPNWITREYYLLITLFLAPFVLKKHYSVSVYGFVVFMDEGGLKYGSFSFHFALSLLTRQTTTRAPNQCAFSK